MAPELVDADVITPREFRLGRRLRRADLVADLVNGGMRGWGLGALLGGVTERSELLDVEDQRPELVIEGLLNAREPRLSRGESRGVAQVVVRGRRLAGRRRHPGEHHRREGGKAKKRATTHVIDLPRVTANASGTPAAANALTRH